MSTREIHAIVELDIEREVKGVPGVGLEKTGKWDWSVALEGRTYHGRVPTRREAIDRALRAIEERIL